jgi:hypothetical protein
VLSNTELSEVFCLHWVVHKLLSKLVINT